MNHPKTTEQKVINFIKLQNIVLESKTILIALSGGPDSIFALYFFRKFQNKYKIKLATAHVNHSLRGKESDRDEFFCKELCEKLNIQFFTKKVDVLTFAKKNKKSIEEAARILRYDTLNQLSEKANADFIVTAHNSDDNTETVFLNLVNGSGIDGLAGIPIKRDNIIRPFLCIDKSEIEQYLITNKINFIKDSSNKNLDIKRNYLRKKVLPFLKKELNPSLNRTILHTSEIFSKQKKILDFFINSVILEILQQKNSEFYISTLKLKNYPSEVLGEIFKIIFKERLRTEFDYNKFLKLNQLISSQTGTVIELGNNLIATKDRNLIVIKYSVNNETLVKKFSINHFVNYEDKNIIIEKSMNNFENYSKDRNTEIISADNLSKYFYLRRWKKGDRIIPLGMKNYKSVSDLLTNLKVPSHKKKEQLVLVNNKEIIWLVGFIISDKVKITSKTKKFLKLCLN